jgi:lipoprotein NlpI
MRNALLPVLPGLLAIAVSSAHVAAAGPGNELVKQARVALAAGKTAEALALADKAVAADASNAEAFLFRGLLHEDSERHLQAVADFGIVIELNPQAAEAYDHRGSEHFKLGHIARSLADFDKFLELRPKQKPRHWKRGISCYYAGRFEDGQKQFASYEQVDTNDVENSVWHYLCTARIAGVAKARASLLKVGNDRRVPMMQVFALYSGRAEPADVLSAARAGNPSPEQLNERLFYAHLYLGLYYEAAGEQNKAFEHLKKAANEHTVRGYMGDVARVHVALLQKKTEK